jgi:WD40 repeat protein
LCFLGDSEGNIIVWSIKDGKAVRLISNAHDGGVFTMLVIDNKVVTGGKDSRLIEWDSEWQKTGRTLQLPDPQIHGWCRCIAQDQGNFLLVGTTKNSIFKVYLDIKL